MVATTQVKGERDEDEKWTTGTDAGDRKEAGNNATEALLSGGNGSIPEKDIGEKTADICQIRKSRFSDIRWFIANYCFLVLFYLSQNIYNIGVIRTIERKFGLRSAQSGLIMSMNDISHILVVVFVGYFGKKVHKPKYLSVSLLLCAMAGLMMASPYVIFGTGEVTGSPPNDGLNASHASDVLETNGQDDSFCSFDGDDHQCTEEEVQMDSTNMAAYYILLAAQFLSGIGGAGVTTLGFSYIDENSDPHKSAMYIGIVTSVMAFCPVTSLGLAALCLKLPENPALITERNPSDSLWIGCWWLGYVVCAVGLTCSCIPLWFFPRDIIKRVPTQKQVEESKLTIKEHMKEFPKSFTLLMKNIPFMVFVIIGVLHMYLVIGLYSNLPRYVELHFFKPAFVASFVALAGATSAIVGSFFGGYIMKRKKLSVTGACKVVILSSACMCVGVLINMCLACPQLKLAGQWQDEGGFTISTDCNSNCSCSNSRNDYMPVCGEDNLTYFSPCYAGCKRQVNRTYTDCSCVHTSNSSTAGGSVEPDRCPMKCDTLLAFIITSFISSLAGSVSRAPSTIIMFRVVGDERKSFALAINSFVTNLLGCMPAPVLFGALIDSTCIYWETKCTGTGSCLYYDTKKFRLAIYGSGLTFDLLVLICTIVIYYLVKGKNYEKRNDMVISEKIVAEIETPLAEKVPDEKNSND